MNPVLSHSFQMKINGLSKKILSIFIVYHDININEFDSEISSALSKNSAIEVVHVVGYQEDVDKIKSWLNQEDNVSLERLYATVGTSSDALYFIAFDENKGCQSVTSLDGNIIQSQETVEGNRRNSLYSLFCEAGGLQKAPVGTHFAKTSLNHSEEFLRVSNVVESSAAVCLLAFWLLPFLWGKEIKSVFVDTSGIYSIALMAMREGAKRGGISDAVRISSHHSHEGLSDVPLHEVSSSLFVISASTSGGLAQNILKIGALPSNVVTLFSLSSKSQVGEELCNLAKKNNEIGIDCIVNYSADECQFCAKRFHLIPIKGDQFSIVPPNISLVEIKAVDFPSEVKSEVAALLGLRAFVAYRRASSGHAATLGIDVESILNGECSEKNRSVLTVKRQMWENYKRRSLAVSTRHVVACSYPGSRKIADEISDQMKGSLNDNSTPSVVTPEELRNSSPASNTTTLVVAACVDDAKELLSVSRTLRDVQEVGSTSYLVVADMVGSQSEQARLRSNLTYGKYGAGTYNFYSLFKFSIECYEEESSWDAEIKELQHLIDWADGIDRDVPIDIETRITRLREATADGLIDDLFWKSLDGAALHLRSDFALISDARNDPAATQADLFAVFVILLSNLRHNPKANQRLAHNAYERAVLIPGNFDRFNDGVLQACMLRAARPRELAYGACDFQISEQMYEVLCHALPNQDVPEKSEALAEFMIALITSRMTLHQVHLQHFCNKLKEVRGSLGEVVNIFTDYLIHKESLSEYVDDLNPLPVE